MFASGSRQRAATRLGVTLTTLSAVVSSVFSLGFAHASAPIPSVQSYTQSFDSLPSTSNAPWQNNVTLQNWYGAAGTIPYTTITAYDNVSVPPTGGGLYSFGATGSIERALGVFGGFLATDESSQRIGVVIKNTSGSRIKRLAISYTGEQWYDGNTSSEQERLQFKYKKGADSRVALGAADIQTSIGLTSYPALDFNSPQNSAAGAINGNDPANSRKVEGILELQPDLGPNQELLLVWEKDNVAGTDDGLAIDDLSVSAGFGIALPVASCPATITTFRGSSVTEQVSAFDPNGTVTQAQIISAAVPGISLENFVAGVNPGDVATGSLVVAGTVAAGDYPISIQFTSRELNETRTCTTLLKVRDITDLAVAKDGPATYRAGQTITYFITVNPGLGTATSVVVNDTLPSGLTYVSDNSGVTPTITGQQVSWNLGTLSAQKVITLVAQVPSGATGTVTNQVTASTTSQDDNQTDNTASTSAALYVGPADFSESKQTVSATTVKVGQTFTYTLTLNNSGDLDSAFSLTNTLPANLSVVSAPGLTQVGQQLTATGVISGGDQLQYPVTVRANAVGTVVNVAQLTGDGSNRTLAAPAVAIKPSDIYLPLVRK